MKRILWVCLLVFGLILSWSLVYAGDFYVIPTKKKSYAPVEKTGQTAPYRTHDDGNLEKGIAWPTPRFTDNNNGTVTDNLTGLIWLKNANCSGVTVNWNTAIDYAAALYDGCESCFGTGSDCGLSDGSSAGDWRLPNRKELLSLIDLGQYNYALPPVHPFIGVQAFFWSSTTRANGPGSAWYVDFVDGYVIPGDKATGMCYVWPVRDGN